jgi:hypothetical protein
MSRRSKSNGNSSTVTNTKNISHPNEFLADHRQFLSRSLERNDTDMAALTDLNRSLHERKRAILETCGEITLLDLGSGKYKLSPAGDSLEEAGAATAATTDEKDKAEPTTSSTDEKDKEHSDTFPDEAGQELCVDFLLRMKLRRKLLNRLARRLNRVAHAMDGEDVSAPGPPKYGDLRLHVDPAQVQAAEEHWQRQEAARRQLDQEREKHIYADEEEEEIKKWSTDQEEEHRLKYVSDDEKEKAKAKAEIEASEKEKSASTDAKAAPLDQGEKSQEGTNEDQVKEKDVATEQSEAATAEEKESAEGEKVKAEDKMEVDEKPDATASEKAVSPIKVLDNVDYEALREYTDSYEKVLDPATGTFSYTILDQNREEDHLAIKYGAGIGASHRSMSSKDKEAEWKRWQTSLLSRIPEQPTFEELGYQNRVFLMEERRKLALEELKASSKKTPNAEDMAMDDASPKKTSDEDKGDKKDDEEKDDDDMDVDVDEKDSDGAGSDDGKKDEDDKKVDDDLETDDKGDVESPSKKVKEEDEEEEEDEKKADVVPKRNKPISLVPVPSFHEQDLKRIKLVHAELMAASIQDHARRRLEEVTRDYNTGKSPTRDD